MAKAKERAEKIPHKEFIQIWQQSNSVKEVADHFGKPTGWAYQRKKYLTDTLELTGLKDLGGGRESKEELQALIDSTNKPAGKENKGRGTVKTGGGVQHG